MAFWRSVTCFFLSAHFFVFSMSAAYATKRHSNETDRLSLLAFKEKIVGDALSSWNHSLHFCQWYGVTCGRRHERVTALNLSDLSLVGTISPHLGNLIFLSDIHFNNNSLHGKIPEELGRLFRLQYLQLAYNILEGEIPVNLSYCSRLVAIGLTSNNLVGAVPFDLGYLSNLELLSLGSNKFTGSIPVSFGNLSRLSLLNIGRNKLFGSIPHELGQLHSLDYLQLSDNELFGGIPPSIFNLSSLTFFGAVQNHLHGTLPVDLGFTVPNLMEFAIASNLFSGQIPGSLSNLSSLEVLDLSGNNLSGPIPPNLGALQGLVMFLIDKNKLENREREELSFLQEMSNCTHLEELNINENHFSGLLPNSITNLSSNLWGLGLGGNQIYGNLPKGLENLQNLEILSLQSMSLTGEIPASIGKLNKLQGLAMDGNKFSGEIPSSIGNLTSLDLLYLSQNDLNGSIPLSFGNFRYLQELTLSHNSLTGPIPKQVLRLSSLTKFLDLSHNSLSGLVPSEVGSLNNLGLLDLSNNRLSGGIPSTLSSCLNMESLYINKNLFNGTIPASLRSLRGIVHLDLSLNKLSGEIPKYFGEFTFLSYLNLSFNELEGKVPEVRVFKNASAVSIYGNGKLCGGIKEFQLPACPNPPRKQTEEGWHKKKLLIICGTAIFCLFLIFLMALYYCLRETSRRKSRRSICSQEKFLSITYRELLTATNEFSSANLIGEGSYGHVYKGVLENDERVVAVKVLNLHKRGASRSFLAECESLRSVRHRNLVKIITACSSIDFKGNEFKALVFPYFRNGSLDEWLHQERSEEQIQVKNLSLKERVSIAINVASALEYLHHHCEIPIVHRDLKPSNVLLDDDMNAYVGDFGIARFLHEAAGSETTSTLKGTTGYIAPENGMNAKVTTQGDVYSYGILLLEMLTEKRPSDELFANGLSLHQYVKMALPDQVTKIVDPLLLEDGEVANYQRYPNRGNNMLACLSSILHIGVTCSEEQPSKRMEMSSVVSELHSIKDKYLGVGIAYRN